jgi:hypothetical protein
MHNVVVRVLRSIGALSLCLLAAALSSATSAGVQQPEVRIAEMRVEPEQATVGDRIEVTVIVAHDDGVMIIGPGFDADYGGLEVVEIPPPESDGDTTTLREVLTAFAPGDVKVPPLPIEWTAADGASGTVQTPEQSLEVRSVLQPGDDTLRPLKPQLDLDTTAPSPLVPTSVVAMMAALLAFGYYLMRRAVDARPRPPEVVLPPLSPADAARRELDALSAGDPDPRGFYAGIALVVRRYLSAQFDFPAYAMTRTELQREMTRAGIDRWPARVTGNLLEQCDAVQFAGFVPPMERREADLTAAYEIIDITSQGAPAEGSEPAASPA